MTRKDYELIAEGLRAATPQNGYEGDIHTWRECVRVLAVRLSKQNPRFDKERFINACEGAEI